MINVEQLRRAEGRTEQLACRVHPETKRFFDEFSKLNGVSIGSILAALADAFKTEQEQKSK